MASEPDEFPFSFSKLRKNADDLSMLGGDGQSDVEQVGYVGGWCPDPRGSRLQGNTDCDVGPSWR